MQIYWNKRNRLHKKGVFNSHRIGLVQQHGRNFIVLEHLYDRRDVMSNRCINLSSLVGVCLDVIALSVSRQPIGLLCEECRLALAPVLGGHLAAARKRSHQWCLTLTPNNTETVERMTCHCFLRPIRRHLTSSSYA